MTSINPRSARSRGRMLFGTALAGILWLSGLALSARAELKIGWSQRDITPEQPVALAGQFRARVSEGVMDPLTVTALALERGGEHAVMVSCDLVGISLDLRQAVRARLRGIEGLDPAKVVLNATHTHTAPNVDLARRDWGVPLPVVDIEESLAFTADRVVAAVKEAWSRRAPGGIAFGLGRASFGRNRRWVNADGVSTMYGKVDNPAFSHVEGGDDSSVNVLATYTRAGELTGLVLNVACPAQVSEALSVVTADYWHDTRLEVRRRWGEKLYILPQISAAGDQAPHFTTPYNYDHRAEARMLTLYGRSVRQEIAHRMANALAEVLPVLTRTITWDPVLRHRVETVDLPLNRLAPRDRDDAQREAAIWRGRYEQEKQTLAARPPPPDTPRWYVAVTTAFRRMRWYEGVIERFEAQSAHPTQAHEIHLLRIGDVAVATNPFEYYLDYGIQIKARSPAVQTFVVQLAGRGTYVPSARSVGGGGYGSVPASNAIGPEGGGVLREKTLEFLGELWK